jgi:hypothetical protein
MIPQRRERSDIVGSIVSSAMAKLQSKSGR